MWLVASAGMSNEVSDLDPGASRAQSAAVRVSLPSETHGNARSSDISERVESGR